MLKFDRQIIITVLLVLTSACSSEKTPGPPLVSVSLSGTITPALFSSMDSDVNNPDASFVSNDTIETHQVLSNPVILGGYLNLPGRGPSITQSTGKPPGRSLNQGDVVDIYKVDLKVGQRISLKIAEDPASVNLRLRLINSLGAVINADLESGQTQTLTVVQGDIVAGDYYVQVAIYCPNSFSIVCGLLPTDYLGHSNYTLSIGQVDQFSSRRVDLNSEIVPGDIIVKFKQDPNPIQAVGVNALATKADVLGLSVKAGAIGRYSLLKLDNTTLSRNSKLSGLGGFVGSAAQAVTRKSDPQRQLKLQTLLAIQALRRRSDVEYAGPNLIRRALRVPNDTDYGRQWNLGFINLPQAWDITTGTAKNGTSVIVAVIDSGVLLNHPDMVGQLVSGYDFVKDVNYSADGDGLDADPADPGDRPVCNVAAGCFMTTSSSFHGTHVAGTIAARSNDNTGIAGVSWGAKIMPIRVLGREGFGTSFDVMQGVLYAAGLLDSQAPPTQIADIINLSLGGPIPDAFEEAIFGDVRAAGVIVVAAAGNESTSSPVYPAAYDGIISVSAVDANEHLAPYSNFGSSIDVTAPGGRILLGPMNQKIVDKAIYSSLGDDSSGAIRFAYGYYQGTSMAAPHVAGVLALMKAVNPALTPADIDAKLRAGELTDDLGFSAKYNGFGWGLINALKAVKSAQKGSVPPVGPEFRASLDKLLFDGADSEDSFRLENNGSGSITINNIAITYATSGESWLSIIASNAVDASGLGQYFARIDRTGLAEDIYSAKVMVTSDQGIAEIQILMQVADPIKAANRNVGEIYAFIYNGNTGELVQQVKSVFSNGKYSYSFVRIPVGDYLMMAGNDSDNDYEICGRYESCGAYKYLSRPALISVTGTDIDNIDFTIGFDQVEPRQTQSINALGIE
ncbi:MAG: S8 family serine peptidase [Thiohalomonadales bacterium]